MIGWLALGALGALALRRPHVITVHDRAPCRTREQRQVPVYTTRHVYTRPLMKTHARTATFHCPCGNVETDQARAAGYRHPCPMEREHEERVLVTWIWEDT